ncbi:MAG: hypothetical protein IJ728_03755 [Selenomonadaceae bacterium]|nr:hypothetical protein [Selenomonadaceae bacterium]
MKKYIFPIGFLLFVIAISMLISHFTQQAIPKEAKIIEGWKHITFDQMGNAYYINLDTIVNDGKTEDELKFHATFQKIYTDKGREALIAAYKDSGVDVSKIDQVDHEIDILHFRDWGGIKYLSGGNSKFFTADNVEIPELEMNVEYTQDNNQQPIPSKSIGENLYDYAFNRVKK